MIDIPFYFLGNRDYVNAPTIFEESIKAFIEKEGLKLNQIKEIKDFKVTKFIRHNCYLEILKSNVSAIRNSKNAASKMSILVGNDLYKLFLFEKEDSQVNEHVKDYDRSIYIHKEAWKNGESYSVKLCNITNIYSLMRGIIESNYRYCIHYRNKLGSDKKVSFAYLKGLSIQLSNTVGLNLYNKAIVHSRGDVFIVNQIHDERGHNTCCSEICFFYSKGG